MEKGTIYLILCTIASTILLASTIWSCGHRSVAIEKKLIKTDSLYIENTRVLSQNITWSNIGSIKPFNALKPMVIDGKEYFNTVLRFDKSITSDTKIEGSENLSYTGSEVKKNNKQTEKKDNANIWIGMFLILSLFLFLYLKFKL